MNMKYLFFLKIKKNQKILHILIENYIPYLLFSFIISYLLFLHLKIKSDRNHILISDRNRK